MALSASPSYSASPSSSSRSPSIFSFSSSSSSSAISPFPSSSSPPASPLTSPSSSPLPTSSEPASSILSRPVPSRLIPRCLLQCYAGPPPLSHLRPYLHVYAGGPFLGCLFSLQLVLHFVYLAASLLLLAQPSLFTDLLDGRDRPFAFRCLQWLPAFLVVRSMVSIPLTIRRLWLLKRWQSTWIDSAVCSVLLAGTCIVGSLSLTAVAQLPSTTSWMYPASWLLVGSLLLLAGWQLAMYAVFMLFFRSESLTICSPMLPLAQHYYEQPQQDTPKKHEGLTAEQLQAMPVSVYEGGREDVVCAVCMDDVEVGQTQRVLRCGHAYHQPCVDQWLLKKRVCPLCVQAVRPAPTQPSASEWMVEMVERVKPGRSEVGQVSPLIV